MAGVNHNVAVRDIQAELRSAGFRHIRTKGSHATWSSPDEEEMVTVVLTNRAGGQAGPKNVFLIRKAIERYRERAAAASVPPSGPKPVTPATRRLVAKVPINADGRIEAALSVTDEGLWGRITVEEAERHALRLYPPNDWKIFGTREAFARAMERRLLKIRARMRNGDDRINPEGFSIGVRTWEGNIATLWALHGPPGNSPEGWLCIYQGPWEAPPEPVDIDGTFRAIPQLDDGHRVVDGVIQWHWRIEGSDGDGAEWERWCSTHDIRSTAEDIIIGWLEATAAEEEPSATDPKPWADESLPAAARIRALLQEKGWLTRNEIAAITGMPPGTVSGRLTMMGDAVRWRITERSGPGRPAREYALAEAPAPQPSIEPEPQEPEVPTVSPPAPAAAISQDEIESVIDGPIEDQIARLIARVPAWLMSEEEARRHLLREALKRGLADIYCEMVVESPK